MGKPLIIVESPAKATTIKKYLSGKYEVEASAGHIKDLPQSSLGIDIQKGFAPKLEVVRGKKKIVDRLKKAASTADEVFIATDPDREGEAIAWHIAEELKKVVPSARRVLFHEITRDAVRKALEHPRDLDVLMYESQLARRTLDRLVGYQISPILWKKVQGGLSAGRVQSVAVRLVVEREREIEAFDSKEYWLVHAVVHKDEAQSKPFKALLRKIDGRKAELSGKAVTFELVERLREASFRIASLVRKDRPRAPSPPYITSSLQQDASRLLHFSPSHTMSVAQRLYEGVDLGDEGRVGLITYMRTDSVRLSADSVTEARSVIASQFGPDYVPARQVEYRNRRSAQDAHEAIRPTSAERTPASLKGVLERDEQKLYALIYNRFLACQMRPAIFDQTTVDIEAAGAEFRAAGSVMKFDGWLAVWRLDKSARLEDVETSEPEDEGDGGQRLPSSLVEGDALLLDDLLTEQKFTEPPPRFTEATLVRELEERGIGRPSTYASIVSTIQDKSYVYKHEGRLRPSELGRIVNDLLSGHFRGVVDYDFTARMEQDLDLIEEGRLDRLELLEKFYLEFSRTLEQAQGEMRSVKVDAVPSGVRCPECSKELLIRLGKNGAFLGCEGYPECRVTREFDRDVKGHVVVRESPDVGTCPTCQAPLQIRSGKFGKFVACSRYPDCRFTMPYSRGERCPVDGCAGRLVERQSKKGKKFFSCSAYPGCRFITSYEPLEETCPECGAPVLFVRSFRGTRTVMCQREGCGFTRRVLARKAAGSGQG
ncbi:MAG TPA: type I DNA topoisomerase [Myxococcota bacterium]|nr:type I DNA topoisomerase [Myxococcota bacterium]HOA14219.1 type I DNA topoisomerase [Myxococcota bacterium]HOC98654.1 type I DNA topoisomerase [Myxococcota bacterium]HOH77471.1 type I DNA topoisomerase [Myxococcota bacterium]